MLTLLVANGLLPWDNGVCRIRTLKRESDLIPIKSRKTGAPYRYVVPAENHHIDIIEDADGKWHGVAVSIFAANQSKKGRSNNDEAVWRDAHAGAKFIMRLHKNDTMQLFDEDGENRIKRVARLSPSNNILYRAGHQAAGELAKRHNDNPFRWDFANIAKLKDRRAMRVVIDEVKPVRTVPVRRR